MNCSKAAIEDLCQRAQTRFGPVGAICIWPRYVSHARKCLGKAAVPIATVVNFPDGNQSVEMTVAETQAAIADGANEIDLVMPYQAFKAGDEALARAMIVAMRTACGSETLLKVILETGELADDGLVRTASDLAIEAGADFIKTSTGKVAVNATPQVANIMLQAIAESGRQVGFKPAGGIKTTEDCGDYLAIADQIFGPDWASPKNFRFGASSVLNDLLAALDGGSAEAGDGY